MNNMKYLIKHPLGEFVINENGKLIKDKNNAVQNETGNKIFRGNFRNIMKQIGYSDEKLNSKLTEIGIQLTKQNIKQSVKKDKLIIQSMAALEEIDKSINIYIERIREWFGLHCPELENKIKSHEKLVKLISEHGKRQNFKEDEFKDLIKNSIGIDISDEDEKILKKYSFFINQSYELRGYLEKYIDILMKEVSPNLRELAGPLLGARLILLGGGLDKLAKKPTSTIQLLGAEKAFFRFLKGKGKSPKFGIIYQSPYIQNVPFDKQGRVARLLASKLSMAIKIDYYSKEDKSKQLKKQLEQEIKGLK